MYGSRGGRRGHTRAPRPFVKTFKKVILHPQATFGTAGFQNEFMATGTDAIAPGQATAGDVAVPTGSRIRYFEIQFALANVVEQALFINCTIQYFLVGQGGADPATIGGNPQRNQVFHMELFTVGGFQNSLHKFRFKVPPKFQRIREGMSWVMVWRNSDSVVRMTQIIYKIES